MLTLGMGECLSLASSLGVIDLTLPALDNEPCDGTISHLLIIGKNTRGRGSYKRSQGWSLLNIYL